MNKKIPFPIAIIIIVILAVLVGLIIWRYNFIPDFEPRFQNNAKNNSQTKNDRNTLEREIKTLLEDANYCQEDSDCVIKEGYGCPFGCYTLYNKNTDLNEIEKKVKIYNKNYVRCEYECPMPPKTDEIKCENKKCVDVRFKNLLKIDLDVNKKEYKKGEIIEISIYNLDEPVCFESCNLFYLGKKELMGYNWDYWERKCEFNAIAGCINSKETKIFEISVDEIYGTMSYLEKEPKGTYRVKIPIYLSCEERKFPCGKTEILYSDSFEIK